MLFSLHYFKVSYCDIKEC